MIHMKKGVFALIIAIALVLGAVGMVFLGDSGLLGTVLLSSDEYRDYVHMENTYGKMDYLLNFVDRYYYKEVDDSVLIENAYCGLVDGLGDIYSEYISAEEYESYMASLTGDYSGIGMTFSYNEDNVLIVISVTEDSPAEAAGLLPGDLIMAVDGTPYNGDDLNTVGNMIRGTAGTKVTLTIKRGDVQTDYTMERAHIVSKTVKYEMLEGNIGYIKISSFETSTGKDFTLALENLEAKDAGALVIDLRDNGGGIVDEAVKVADELMNKATVVYAEDQAGQREYYTTSDGCTDLPFVVLVNGGSASASEILAAGIQDNLEAPIVGTQTYGKGIIQTIVPFSDGSAIKLTTMQYYSPSGKVIHGKGITPDHVVELADGDSSDYQLIKALELLK